jgi:hypothetical protein
VLEEILDGILNSRMRKKRARRYGYFAFDGRHESIDFSEAVFDRFTEVFLAF